MIQSWSVVVRVPIFVSDVVAIEADRALCMVVIEAALVKIVIVPVVTRRADQDRESLLRNARLLEADPNRQRPQAILVHLVLDRDVHLLDLAAPVLDQDVHPLVHAPAPILPVLIEINPLGNL